MWKREQCHEWMIEKSTDWMPCEFLLEYCSLSQSNKTISVTEAIPNLFILTLLDLCRAEMSKTKWVLPLYAKHFTENVPYIGKLDEN